MTKPLVPYNTPMFSKEGGLTLPWQAFFRALSSGSGGTSVTFPITIAEGGTGQTTQAAALTALAGTQGAGQYLRSDGTNTVLSAIQAGDVPTLNQNTSGSAATASTATAPVTGSAHGAVTLDSSGHFQSVAPGTAGHFLRSNGTDYVDSAIQAADVPTLNQSTSGNAATATAPAAGSAHGAVTLDSSGHFQSVAPGTAGHFLRSNGTDYVDSAIQASDLSGITNTQLSGAAGITNANLANMNAHTYKGNNTGSAAAPSDVTAANVLADISPLTTKGDIMTYSSSNIRQAVPGDNGRLVPDSAQTSGWRSASYTTGLNGSPLKNYIQYADFENGSSIGWSLGTIGTLTNGLPTGSPTFGSGANGNLSLVMTASSLSGAWSVNFTSVAASTKGDMMASSSYAIDTSDQGKVLGVRFLYSTNTSTNVNFSGTSSNSIAWAVYDVTNSVWLPSAGNFNIVQTSGVGVCTGTIQTGATTANIRLVIYNANASSGAFAITLDDFYVGPQQTQRGPAVTDWISYTPTGAWNTNTSYSGFWRRVGDTMEMYARATLSGAPNSATFTVSIPSGYTIDTTKLITTEELTLLGRAKLRKHLTGSYNLTQVLYYDSTHVSVNGVNLSSFTGTQELPDTYQANQATPFTFGANDYVELWAVVPIVGWSSNTMMSSDTDTRVVAASAYRSGSQTGVNPNNSAVQIQLNSVTPTNGVGYDTHGAMNTGTFNYVVPVTGYYRINGSIQVNSTNVLNNSYWAVIYLAGNAQLYGASVIPAVSTSFQAAVSGDVYATAGQSIALYLFGSGNNSASTLTVAGNSGNTYMTVSRISGPAVVAATESVNARAYQNSQQTGVNPNNSAVQINFDTASFDSHSGISSNQYKVPVSGKYQLNARLSVAATNVLNSLYYAAIYKNGSLYSYGPNVITAANNGFAVGVSDVVNANAGDTIAVYLYGAGNNSASTLSMNTGSGVTCFSVARVGN